MAAPQRARNASLDGARREQLVDDAVAVRLQARRPEQEVFAARQMGAGQRQGGFVHSFIARFFPQSFWMPRRVMTGPHTAASFFMVCAKGSGPRALGGSM
jgi:hypothetical protein